VSGTTDELSLEDSTIGATALLVGNGGAPLVSANRIGGTLNCLANNPAPVNNGLTNQASAGKGGQCQTL